MRRVQTLLLSGLLTALSSSCHRSAQSGGGVVAEREVERPYGLVIVDSRPTLRDVAKAAPADARRLFTDVYGLQPDRRFLFAAAEIERLVTGAKTVRLRLEVHEGQWTVFSGSRRVGAFTPELAYSGIVAVLESWSHGLLRDAPPAPCQGLAPERRARIEKELDSFYPPGPFSALEEVDRLWQPKHPDCGLLDLAARSLLLLQLERLDNLEITDGLAGRTLAAETLARVMGAPRRPGDEALLAYLLGYRKDAEAMAAALSPADPIRLYVTGETAALVRLASEPAASEPTRYFALRALASGREGTTYRGWASAEERAGWSDFAHAHFGSRVSELPILRAGLEMNAFETNASFASAIFYSAASEVSNHLRRAVPGPPSAEPSADDWLTPLIERFIAGVRKQQGMSTPGFVRTFETRLAQESVGKKGLFWDADAVRSYYRGFFYGGLFTLGEHFRNDLSSVQATREFAEYLKDPPPGVGAQFSRWYADLASLKSGQPVTDRQIQDLSALDALGAPAAFRTFAELQGYWPGGYDSAPAASALMVRRLDSRPWQRGAWTLDSFDVLMDLRLAETMCRSWLLHEPNDDPGPLIRCVRAKSDTKTLLGIADEKRYGIGTRVSALSALTKFPVAEPECRSRFRSLAAETGYSADVLGPYFDYAEHQRKDFAESERVVREWLARHGEADDLQHAVYRGHLAHLRQVQGHVAEAWKLIEPEVASDQGSVLGWAMEILAASGRRDDALNLGRHLVDRYPDSSSSRAQFAGQLWEAKRYSEAALVLDPPEERYKPPSGDWGGVISRHFVLVLGKKSDAEVLSAMNAMKAQGIRDGQIEQLIPAFDKISRSDLAFQMQTRLTSPLHSHTWDIALARLRAAQYLEKGKGRPAALAWLRENVVPEHREAFAEICYDQRAFDFLWEGFPSGVTLSEWSWLLRAASVAANPASGSRRDELVAHYSDPAPRDSRRALARSILALPEDTGAAAPTKGADVRCEASYFQAIRAIGQGRYDEASDLLHVVGATCQQSWRVSRFARTTVFKWYWDHGTLAEAAAAKAW